MQTCGTPTLYLRNFRLKTTELDFYHVLQLFLFLNTLQSFKFTEQISSVLQETGCRLTLKMTSF